MKKSTALPFNLLLGHRHWRAGAFAMQRSLFKDLADNGQKPQTMIISCCDSRIHPTALFGDGHGEFFIHRNIANLVPNIADQSQHQGAIAPIEYAVSFLGVQHIVILGHSDCGGIKAAHEIFSKTSAIDPSSSIYQWLQIVRHAFDALKKSNDSSNITDLEKRSILVSLDNLMQYPFIQAAMKDNRLSLYGLWHDIGAGQLFCYNAQTDSFDPPE